MAHHLFAVLVPATATVTAIDARRPVTGGWPGPCRPGGPGRTRDRIEPAGWSVAVVDADS